MKIPSFQNYLHRRAAAYTHSKLPETLFTDTEEDSLK